MSRILLILMVVITLTFPEISHGFGILRWGWDGLRNQVGFDRGPIPKIVPKICHPNYDPRNNRDPLNARNPPYYIQAEGF